jgi:hypothetical protein
MMQLRQNAVMRTTLDLPDDLHHIVTSLALHQRASLSQTAVQLMRRGLALGGLAPGELAPVPHAVTGLPVLTSSRAITVEDVQALDDE